MKRCFELADESRKRGDTAVGSLIADASGEIIAEASEQNRTNDLFAHAELLVIQQAIKIRRSNDLSGLLLFTTNEPCFLCSFAIRQTVCFAGHFRPKNSRDRRNFFKLPDSVGK